MGERSFSEIVLGADARQSRSRRLYRVGEVTSVCGDLATVRVDADDAGDEVCLRDLQVLGPWAVQVGDWVELGYLDDHPNSAYVRSPLFSETRDPALGFKARLTVGDWDAVVDVNGGGDFTSIQSALDAGCKTILVRKGTYSQSAANLVVAQPDVRIVGESQAESVIDFGGTGYYLWAQGAALRFGLRNIKVQNSQQSTYAAVRIDAQSVEIFNCRLDSNARHLYVTAGADYAFVHECVFAEGQPLYSYADFARFVANRIYNTSLQDMVVSASQSAVLDNTARYVRCYIGGVGCAVSNNAIELGQVYLSGASYARVVGNHIKGVTGPAIPLNGQRCVIEGNTIYDPPGHGIDVWGGDHNVVKGNVIYSAGGVGIVTTRNRAVIAGNQVLDGANWGISIAAGATNNVVAHNVVIGNAGGQIQDLGTGTVLDSNITA